MTLRDPEVLDLLADDPTLLALADAVVATQQAPRRPLFRRTAPRVAVVAVVAAAAIIVALVLPQGEHGIVDRAIAAIGDGRVMHIVSEMPIGTVDVDLQSGRRTVQQARVEFWADQQLKRFHVVMTFNSQVVLDLLWPQDAERGVTIGTIDPRLRPSGRAIGKRSKTARRRASAKATPSVTTSTGCVSAPRRRGRPAPRSPSTRRPTSRSSSASTTAPATATCTSSSPEQRLLRGRLHA